MAFCDRQLYFFYFIFYTRLNCGAGAIIIIINIFLFFFVCDEELTVQQDNDVLLSGFLLANAVGTESGGQPEVVEWCC